MSKETAVFVCGVIVFFTPFLGVPSEYKKWILIVFGVVLMGIGYTLRRRAFLQSIEHEGGARQTDAFVESAPVVSLSEKESEAVEVRSI